VVTPRRARYPERSAPGTPQRPPLHAPAPIAVGGGAGGGGPADVRDLREALRWHSERIDELHGEISHLAEPLTPQKLSFHQPMPEPPLMTPPPPAPAPRAALAAAVAGAARFLPAAPAAPPPAAAAASACALPSQTSHLRQDGVGRCEPQQSRL